MTPRGRAALVLGFVIVIGAIVAGTVEVRVGTHECGSAVSAHAPAGHGEAQSRAEDLCDSKVTGRRWLVGVIGVAVSGPLIPVLRKRRQQRELERMTAVDATG